MPIHEYKCNACGEKYELKVSFMQGNKPVKCPKCGSGAGERVTTPVAKIISESAKYSTSPDEMTDCGCDSGDCELPPTEHTKSSCDSGPIR